MKNNNNNNHKRLLGIRITNDLEVLLNNAYTLIPNNGSSNDKSNKNGVMNNDDNTTASDEKVPTLIDSVHPMSEDDAESVLKEYRVLNHDKRTDFIPIHVIKAMDSIFLINDDNDKNQNSNVQQLQCAIKNCGGFVYTPSSIETSLSLNEKNVTYDDYNKIDSSLTKEQRKFQQRMIRLRLKFEESKYSKITTNLGMRPRTDDVTTKSMTYAASIGLNMIIAPLSFGCLMYFFAGSILDYFWPREFTDLRIKHHMVNQPDIRKVIAGVVSGVLMLFIEMILFVIRTHEIDKATSKKKKKVGFQPFGHYTSATEKTFETKKKNT